MRSLEARALLLEHVEQVGEKLLADPDAGVADLDRYAGAQSDHVGFARSVYLLGCLRRPWKQDLTNGDGNVSLVRELDRIANQIG